MSPTVMLTFVSSPRAARSRASENSVALVNRRARPQNVLEGKKKLANGIRDSMFAV